MLSVGGRAMGIGMALLVLARVAGDFSRATPPSPLNDEATDNLEPESTNLGVLQESEARSPLAFLRLVISKDEIYLGESLPLRIELYSMNARDIQMAPLSAEGFTLGQSAVLPPRDVRISNHVYRLDTEVLSAVATKPGDLLLGPARCRLTLQLPVRRQRPFGTSPDRFTEPFAADYRLQTAVISNRPVRIHVLPLPQENVPPGFTGAVGEYSLAVTASPTNVAVGEPIQVRIELSGRGALDKLALPRLQGWEGFKVYPPTARVEIDDALGTRGTKRFRLDAVPERVGITNSPEVVFSYFDAQAEQYRTLKSKPLALTVRPGGAPPMPENAGPLPYGGSIDAASDGLAQLKLHAGPMRPAGKPLVQRPWFLLLQTAPLLGYAGAVFWRRRRDYYATNPRAMRRVEVDRDLPGGLARLSWLADQEDHSEDFFSLAFRLIQDRLGERLDRPSASITEAVIEETLQPAGLSSEFLDRLRTLFARCNVERFSHEGTKQDLDLALREVRDLLEEVRQIEL